jgi:sulfoxide reductase heme-binding subunit YedZ
MSIDLAPLPNLLGFVALGFYIATLLPTTLRIVVPRSRQNDIPKILLKYRRAIGVLAFCFALWHGWLLVKKRNFDFFDLQTYWIYIQGITTFIIFTLLAITSNDWSIKRLKKNWKRLHSLTYLAMFLLTWHVWDKMAQHWSYVTPISLVGIVSINILFFLRRWIESKKPKSKAITTENSPELREKASIQ